MSNKISQEELNEITTIAESEQRVAAQLGFIESEIQNLKSSKEGVLTNLTELKNIRQDKLKQLKEKYGAGTLNIDTGEFTSTK